MKVHLDAILYKMKADYYSFIYECLKGEDGILKNERKKSIPRDKQHIINEVNNYFESIVNERDQIDDEIRALDRARVKDKKQDKGVDEGTGDSVEQSSIWDKINPKAWRIVENEKNNSDPPNKRFYKKVKDLLKFVEFEVILEYEKAIRRIFQIGFNLA